jgi:hypothetical protein
MDGINSAMKISEKKPTTGNPMMVVGEGVVGNGDVAGIAVRKMRAKIRPPNIPATTVNA